MRQGETATEPDSAAAPAERQQRQSMAEQYFARLEAMRDVVEKYSPDGGDLHPDVVAQITRDLGLKLDAAKLADALTEMDSNGDGAISPMDFEAWIKRQIMRTKHVPMRPTKTDAEPEADAEADADVEESEFSQLRQPNEDNATHSAAAAVGYGTNAAAWAAFRRLDADGSGTLDREEFAAIAQELRLGLSKKEMNDAWRHHLDPLETGEASYDDFALFFNRIKARERVRLLRKVSTYFERADVDGDGLLTKEEFALVLGKSKIRLDPPFDTDADWDKLNKTRTGDFPEFEYEVSYRDFSSWFKERLQMEDADIPGQPKRIVILRCHFILKTTPFCQDRLGTDIGKALKKRCVFSVLPEFLVAKIEEAAFFNATEGDKKKGLLSEKRAHVIGSQRSGKELWASLRPRLVALVQLQRQWGRVHDIYHVDSHIEGGDLSKWIRDPGAKRHFLRCHLYIKMHHHFTKTGSGQT